jgi:hypothetical protein
MFNNHITAGDFNVIENEVKVFFAYLQKFFQILLSIELATFLRESQRDYKAMGQRGHHGRLGKWPEIPKMKVGFFLLAVDIRQPWWYG